MTRGRSRNSYAAGTTPSLRRRGRVTDTASSSPETELHPNRWQAESDLWLPEFDLRGGAAARPTPSAAAGESNIRPVLQVT